MEFNAEISKLDQDKHLVFGWAYVSHDAGGMLQIDKSGDFVTSIEELEKSAYDFVLNSRDGGDTHIRKGVSTMVESMVFTPDKLVKMGLPEGLLPTGWWVGFKVHDDEVWKAVKEGRYKSFSIHGSGVRKRVEADIEKHGNKGDPGYAAKHPNSILNRRKGLPLSGAGSRVSDLVPGTGGRKKRPGATPTPATTAPKTKVKPTKTSNVEEAVRLLAEGKAVELDQPSTVSTLLNRLVEIVQDAEKKGEKAPVYNLCQVSVKGTNLFCAQSKGVPRVRMPQLSGRPVSGSKADKLPRNDRGEVDLAPQFREAIAARGVKITDTTTKASYLKASQNELNGGKVAGIAKARREGKLKEGRIFTSRDDYIVDGHHRWAGIVGVDLEDNREGDLDIQIARIDMSIIEVLAMANNFAASWGIPPASVGQSSVHKGVCLAADFIFRDLLAPASLSDEFRFKEIIDA